jgi:hypothetical protein
MTEIDREHFCSRYQVLPDECDNHKCPECCHPIDVVKNGRKGCAFCHRKWPTPEQFEEEYGYKPYGLFYWIRIGGEWMPDEEESPSVYREDVNYGSCLNEIVVACTPYGKPPDNWRPKK